MIFRLSKLISDQRGNAIVICAAALPLLIGASAIGVDTIQVSLARRQLQRTADSAALAGAYALAQQRSVAAAVNHDLSLNNELVLNAAPGIENAPASGPHAGDNRAVRIALATERSVPFIHFFTGAPMTVRVEATAALVYTGAYCAIALEDQAVTGIRMGGNTTVDLGCGMITNSRSGQAAYAFGNAYVNASPMAAVGGIPQTNNYDPDTVFLPYSLAQEDPYRDLPDPAVPNNCAGPISVQPNEAETITPSDNGIYCFRGMNVKGTLNLAPGIYYIDGGSLSFGAQSNVTGTGVTFILTSSNALNSPSQIADLDINGGATLDLRAPSSGTYAGVLFYQDRRAPFGTSRINGNSASRLYGGFYFRSRELVFNGAAGMTTECIQLVSRQIQFTGNARIQNQCPANGGAQAFQARLVRLVG